jgi:hypothetical protein
VTTPERNGTTRLEQIVGALNDEANALTVRAETAEAKVIVLEAALRKIAAEPPDRGVTPNFRQFARDVLEAYDRG